MKLTSIAQKMGFTTTTQLHNGLKGSSLLSTKAIVNLIENLNVNPNFLFLGKGEMFVTDESKLEKLQEEYNELKRKHADLGNQYYELVKELKRAEDRYKQLIDITYAALEKTKNKQEEEDNTNNNEKGK
ncbi:MAG: hypothetical protein ACOCP4_05875 [Candidatus Woesearchaeota archaeon]